MVAKPILDAQRKPVEPTVTAVPLSSVDVVRGKDNSFPEKAIVEHQHSSIEVLEFVVPEDMKDPRPRPCGVLRQTRIVGNNTSDFAAQGSILALIAAQIQED